MSKLPKHLYAKIDKDGDEEYIIADPDPSKISEAEKSIRAGYYTLVKTVEIVNITDVKP